MKIFICIILNKLYRYVLLLSIKLILPLEKGFTEGDENMISGLFVCYIFLVESK